MSVESPPTKPVRFDRMRFLRVVIFFAGAFLSVIWWDLIVRRIPGLRGMAERSSISRWQRIARRFRRLAVQLGGVLIKLGQFLSIRVDVLPPEVTNELADLQDEVPAEDLADVLAVVEEEFGRPVQQVFDKFAPEPEAAASLAQVHKARLIGGEHVVVKIQRRRIETLVETDLTAIRTAVNWLKLYRRVARRVDLDQLFDEFARTTRAELDFVAEGKNAERFAADFADEAGICIAKVFWDYTTRRVLTLENVASIKITDYDAIEAAGISRAQVARRLYDTYLRQVFATNFVHADPHPGNLFVQPLDRVPGAGPDEPRPFLLIFVDFGMVAIIPERLRAHLRDYLIGLGTRDSRRIVQAYIDSGVLLPSADRRRLEEVHDVMFQRFWGMKMGEFREIAFEEAEFFLNEYRDIIYEMPFQLPVDILFVGRAVGILSGMATSLDPEFDPWAATIPFAEQLAAEELLIRDWRGWLEQLGGLVRVALGLPARLDQVLSQVQYRDLTTQAMLAPDSARALRRIERSVERLTWMVVAIGLLVSGMLLRTTDGPGWPSTALFMLTGLAVLWGATRR